MIASGLLITEEESGPGPEIDVAGQAVKLGRRGNRDVFSPEAVFLLDGVERQVDFRDLADARLEFASPVREFPSWQHKKNYSGFYWASTTGAHVGFESLTERTALMMLDRDPSVVGIASQPTWVYWPRGHEPGSHAPDVFVRHASGDGELIDVRPVSQIDAAAAACFDATAALCAEAGLRYRVISEITPILAQNLLFLARYRREEFSLPADRHQALAALVGESTTVGGLVAVLAGGVPMPVALGWVAWMIWVGLVETDLEVILGVESPARVCEEVTR